jgi:hypothetical protein
MKNSIIIFILITHSFTFGQTIEHYPEFPIPSLLYATRDFNHIYKGKSYFHEQIGDYVNLEQKYIVIDYESGNTEERSYGIIKEGNYSGKITAIIAHDNFVYELITFTEKAMSSKCKVGLIKRDLITLEQIGTTVWLANYDTPNSFQNSKSKIIKSKKDTKGFFVISGKQSYGNIEDKHSFIKRFNFDLEEEWSHSSNYLNEDYVALQNIDTDIEGNLIVSLGINSENAKKWDFSSKPDKYGQVLIVYPISGEEHIITPQLNESINLMNTNYNYVQKLNQLTAIMIHSKPNIDSKADIEGLGYSFYKWDGKGEIIEYSTKVFVLADFMQTPYLNDYLTNARLTSKHVEHKSGQLITPLSIENTNIIYDKENSIVIINGYNLRGGMNQTPIDQLYKSKIIFSISPKGELNWFHFFPVATDRRGHFFASKIHNQKLLLYSSEFKENFENGEFKFKVFKSGVNWENLQLGVRKINISSGEIESFSVVNGIAQETFKVVGCINLAYHEMNSENNLIFINFGVDKEIRQYVKYTND